MDPQLLGQRRYALGGVVALHHRVAFAQVPGHMLSPPDGNAGHVVAGMGRGTGHDHIPHAGQPKAGVLLPARRLYQRGKLHQRPAHHQGLGVIAAAHALGHAGRQRYNIFGRAAQLHPGNIGAAVNTKARVHKNALHPFGNGFFRAGRHAAGGHLPRYLLRVGGTRKRRYRISRQLLRQDLRHPQTAFRLHALGHRHQHCSRR